ncbi:MAG TPA: ATP-binding protein [Candidatus Binatia bacterium]|nr:ATP-binding protein [Candidatus Binatia bacterium]
MPARGRLAPYAVAVGAIAAATLLSVALHTVLRGALPFALYSVAVLYVAWFGGVGPAFAALTLGLLAATYVLAPYGRLTLDDPAALLGLGIYSAVGLTAAGFSDSLRRAESRARKAATQLDALLSRETAARREADDSRALAEEARRELDDLFESAATPVRWIDMDGTILRANACELELMGYAREEYVGRPLADFHTDPGTAADLLARLRRGDTVRDLPATLVRKDGTIRHVLVSANAFRRNGELVHGRCFTRDVTAQRAIEAERTELLALAERGRTQAEAAAAMSLKLQTITDAALADLPLQELLVELLQRITAVLDVERGVILLHDSATDTLTVRAASKGFEAEVEGKVRIPVGKGFAGRIAVSRRPAIIDDVRKSDVVNPFLRAEGIRSLLGAPLLFEGRLIGVIDVGSKEPRGFTESDTTLLKLVGDRVALAIARTQSYEAEQRARQAAEAADRAKEEFLAMLAHELRNPLAPLSNALHLLGYDVSGRERFIEMARRQVKHLGRLVDDLLDVARITRGHIELRRTRVDLRAVVEAAVQAGRSQVDARGLQLSVAVPETAVEVEADEVRMEQVLGNLVGNAAKYTPAGGHVWVSLERVGETAVIRVRDDGIGIAPDMIGRVFELFAQADRSLVRERGGLGIGLTVVRRLVEMHGGRVEARSEGVGHGSEFSMRLPALPPRPEAAAPVAPSPAAAEERRLAILVVDDNQDSAESLAMLLELAGHTVATAHDGLAALDRVRASRPDVVLLDIGLPGIDGYEVARRVRLLPEGDGIVLVAVSGYGQEDDRRRAVEAGFDHHLVKPVDLHALERLLGQVEAAEGRAGDRPLTLH